jgi:hypothetical protein
LALTRLEAVRHSDEVPNTTYARLLERAAELLGGHEQLRRYLDVTGVQLGLWMQGRSTPPDTVFLRLADLVAEKDRVGPT